MASPPRVSSPGTIWKLTHSVTTREYQLRPDPIISQIFLFLLAHYAGRHGLRVHLATVLSNHLHIFLTDVDGDQIQPFNRNFFSTFSRAVNVARKRRGNLLDPFKVNCVDVCPRSEDLVHHGCYLSMNAVEAGLIGRARKWPGVNFLPADMGTLKLDIKRPPCFFRTRDGFPEKVTLELTVPEAVDATPEELRRQMIAEHTRRENAKRQAMADTRQTFLGRKRILRRSIHSKPRHDRPLFERVPHVACKDPNLRIRMLDWRQDRNARYRKALMRARDDVEGVVFPVGTWFQHFLCGRHREPTNGSIWYALMALP